MRVTVIYIISVLLLMSCKKELTINCKLTSGDIVSDFRSVSDYKNILIKDNISVVFKKMQDGIIEVEAGRNLLSNIRTSTNDQGWLVLENLNSCDWARDYKQTVNVYLDSKGIDTIHYASIGNVSSIDTLITDTLCVKVTEGSGEISPVISTSILYCQLHYGTSDIKLKGTCRISYVYSASFGLVDLRDISTEIVYVNSISSNDTYVNAQNALGAQIQNIGNIYYTGNPEDVTFIKEGQGELIKLP